MEVCRKGNAAEGVDMVELGVIGASMEVVTVIKEEPQALQGKLEEEEARLDLWHARFNRKEKRVIVQEAFGLRDVTNDQQVVCPEANVDNLNQGMFFNSCVHNTEAMVITANKANIAQLQQSYFEDHLCTRVVLNMLTMWDAYHSYGGGVSEEEDHEVNDFEVEKNMRVIGCRARGRDNQTPTLRVEIDAEVIIKREIGDNVVDMSSGAVVGDDYTNQANQEKIKNFTEEEQLHDYNHYHRQALKDLQHSIDTLTQTVNSLEAHHMSQHHTNHPSHEHFPLSNTASPSMRIEQSDPPISWHKFLLKNYLPKFDGKDPYAWIIQSREFFEYHNVFHEQRLSCVYFMVHGEALEWFHWMKSNELLRSWDDFLEQVKFRFDPIYFEDFTVQFPKFHQAPTVTAYQAEYEKLSPLTQNEGQHEVGYIKHPIEYSNTKCENGFDVDFTLEEHVTLSQDHPLVESSGQQRRKRSPPEATTLKQSWQRLTSARTSGEEAA
nr:Retrotransposon gag protein [Ipomoea batatas]